MKPLRLLVLASAMSAPASALAQPGPPPPPPAPLAVERADLDGDGKPDEIRLEAGGITVAVTGASPSWAPLALPGRTVTGGSIQVAGARIVVTAVLADARGRLEREAVALEWQPTRRRAEVLWRGSVGPQGSDGEYELHVVPTHQGLLQYQSRPGYARCDAEPSYLFPQRLHKGSFRPVVNTVPVPERAPTLTATRTAPRDVPAGATPVVFDVVAASHQLGANHAGELATPREIDDGDPRTAWREGMGGFGKGEFVTARSTIGGAKVRALRIIPGDARDQASFRAHNRLKRLGLVVGAGQYYWIDFPRDPADEAGAPADAYWVVLPAPAAVDCVSVVVADVYRGRSGDPDTAIAELAVLTDLDLKEGGAEGTLAAQVAAGGEAWRSAAHALRDRGELAALALVAAAEAAGERPDALRRLRRTLAEIGHPAGAAQLELGLRASGTPAEDRTRFANALAGMSGAGIDALRSVLSGDGVPEAARLAAAEALSRSDVPEAHAALWERAGAGSRAERRRVAQLLGRVGSVAAAQREVEAAREAGNLAREADLWRALGYLALEQPAQAEALAGTFAARLAEAEDYELRYRLFGAAAAVPHRDAIAAVGRALSATGAGARGEALRRVAAEALGKNPAPEARALLVELTGDADAGVRLSATRALAGRADGDATSDRALIARLEGERWPDVRRTAAGALSTRCSVAAPAAALRGRVAADEETPVRLGALAALATCSAPELGPYLLEVAADRRQRADVRARAATLIGGLGDASLAPPLVTLLRSTRDESLVSPESRRVAEAAAVALGSLGGPDVVPPLLAAARDTAFPSIQAAAVRGLAKLCPPESAALLRELSLSPEHAVATAARQALRTCQRQPAR